MPFIRFGPRPLFPPRPLRPPLAEPSVPRPLLAVIALLGARRVMPPAVQRRLEMTGLAWATDLAPVLERVRTIDDWAAAFAAASDDAERAGQFKPAQAFAFLGQLILSPFHPRKAELRETFRRCYVESRKSNPDICFEQARLGGGAIGALRETPRNVDRKNSAKPTVVLLPPLASTKEELSLLADPLLAAGYPVIRLDMPGQGESPGPLRRDSELVLARALAEWEPAGEAPNPGFVAGGISLGAHFALRLAACDPARFRAAFAISPPGIVTTAHWANLPEVVYQYLDHYLAGETRADTYQTCLTLTLDDRLPDMRHPIRLYHARRDPIAQYDVVERYRAALPAPAARMTDRVYRDRHGCLRYLPEIAQDMIDWMESEIGAAQGSNCHSACGM